MGGQGSRLGFHRQQLPFPGNPLESVAAAFGKLDTGTSHQITDGARNQHLTSIRECGDSGTDMYRNSGEVISPKLAFARVETGPDFDSQARRTSCDRLGASYGACGAIEAGEKSIACGIYLLTPKLGELATNGAIVLVEDLPPALIAEL